MKVTKFKENSRNPGIVDESFKQAEQSDVVIVEEAKNNRSSKPSTHRRVISANKITVKKKNYSQSDEKHYRTEAVKSIISSMDHAGQIYKISQLISENKEIFDYKQPFSDKIVL